MLIRFASTTNPGAVRTIIYSTEEQRKVNVKKKELNMFTLLFLLKYITLQASAKQLVVCLYAYATATLGKN